MDKTCECECECEEKATQQDEGTYLCDECADYYVDDHGDCVCSREQDTDSCRHCLAQIDWGPIQTGPTGVSNWIEGQCDCRQWRQTDCGGTWALAEAAES